MIDSRHPPTKLDGELASLLSTTELMRVVALTKVDKLSGNKRRTAERRMSAVLAEWGTTVPVVSLSSMTGRGKAELLAHIGHSLAEL